MKNVAYPTGMSTKEEIRAAESVFAPKSMENAVTILAHLAVILYSPF